ncbi:MAG: hypothetical protein ACYC7F_04785 [Gemmatimonadaceae bacterium]
MQIPLPDLVSVPPPAMKTAASCSLRSLAASSDRPPRHPALAIAGLPPALYTMSPQVAIRAVIALLAFEAVAPALAARAIVTEPEGVVRAFGLLAFVLALGLWAGRRLALVLARGYAGLQVLVTSALLLTALVSPSASFFVLEPAHPLPRVAGVAMMSFLAATGWWQFRQLGRKDVTALFAEASW